MFIPARICVAFVVCVLHASAVHAQATSRSGRPAAEATRPTVVYFVLHAQVDPAQPTFPLNPDGRLRADAFARTVRSVAFTHVFSSHTTRARQMVDPVAQDHQLVVRQLPEPGTSIDGSVVSDRTASRVAIVPVVDALRELPRGSSALVGLNSDNIHAVLNGLGVPAATPDRPCTTGSTCVPCLTNACITPTYDQLWILILDPHRPLPTLIELRYGAPFPK
jgi:hypothetical protein